MNTKTLPNPGNYNARRTAPMVIFSPESGALMLCIPYTLTNSDVPFSGKHNVCLGKKDGTLQNNAIANLRKIWPQWDGDLFALESVPMPADDAPEFELAECFHEDFTDKEGNSRTAFKANWINPLGGGAVDTPAPMDEAARKNTLTRWGAKWKASTTGKTVPRPAPSPTPRPVPPKRTATTATADEVWDAFAAKNPGIDDAKLGDMFWAMIETECGKTEGLTPDEWGRVKAKL